MGLKPYFHYSCALRCVARENGNTIGVSISLATQRNARHVRDKPLECELAMMAFDDGCVYYVQITLSIDGQETVKNFGYNVYLINPGSHVYLGGSDNVTSHVHHGHHFRGIIQRVRINPLT